MNCFGFQIATFCGKALDVSSMMQITQGTCLSQNQFGFDLSLEGECSDMYNAVKYPAREFNHGHCLSQN